MNKTTKTLIICSIFIGGIISEVLNLNLFYFGLGIFFLLYFAFSKKISAKLAVSCFAVGAVSVLYTIYSAPSPDGLAKIAPIKTIIKGRVISQPNIYKNRTKLELKIFSAKLKQNFKKINGRTIVYINTYRQKNPKTIQIGDILELKASIKHPFTATNPGQFDYSEYLKNRKIFTTSHCKYKDIISIRSPKFGYWLFIQKFNRVKDKIIGVHSKFLKSPKLEILGGIVFGDYAIPTPANIKKNFISSGLLHLLAASGMNVGFIYSLWFFTSRRFGMPFKMSLIIGAGLVLLYALLTGMPPSVMRATLIFEFILFGKLIDRSADNITLLAFACALILLFNPYLITNIGFQLSFIVSFALLFCMPVLMEKTKSVTDLLAGAVLVPVVAQIWAAPIQLFHFNSFTLYSVLANIIVLPVTVVITYVGFISSLLSLIPLFGEKICWLSDKFVEPFISVLLFVSEYTSKLPHSIEYFATPKIFAIIVFYMAIIFLIVSIKYNFSKKTFNYAALGLAILCFSLCIKIPLSQELKIVFFDVGESDSILVSTPNNKNILVDAGNPGFRGFSSASSIIVPYLRDKGIKKLDALVLTHPDRDHIGGTIDILKSIKVAQIYNNGEASRSKTYRKIQKYIAKNRINNKVLNNNTEITLDEGIKILAIKGENTNKASHNENSIILYIKYDKFSALLTGDAEKDSLNLIKKYIKEPVYILKVGHHGSKKSVDDKFLKFLNPQMAVISVGKNRYLHPSVVAINTLKRNNVKYYRTDKDSAILLNTDGNKTVVQRYIDIKAK